MRSLAARIGAFALVASLVAFPARAEKTGRPRVTFVAARAGDPLAPRLRAELSALGFDLVEVTRESEPPSRAALERAAEETGADAAIAIRRAADVDAKRVEIWIADRVTRKTLLRDLIEDEAPLDDGVIANRAVELLRASFVELEIASRAPATPAIAAQVGAARPSALAPNDPRFALELAPGVAMSPGGFGPSANLVVGARWLADARVDLGILGAVPITSATLGQAQGDARVAMSLFAVGIRFPLAARDARLQPSLEGGAGVAWLELTGVGGPGFRGQRHDVVTPSPYVRGSVAYSMTRRFALRADALAASTLAVPVVRFVGEEVGRWGRPFFMGAIGVEIKW